ncbi:hypothetical protein JQ554_16685 [Bradyrhizobium diazoefficiens]|nr:hypothetical protein [Bradyrhizobium diazoefficiens]MBR0965833.1 hypothetical protein [Bradyrhizobium diazoefficiens]MBR0975870.1 hypothetical protein [Bradyrhizobium diazoefficiens]MBR1008840.1 hypothetical protein [Bradyrhizobium diazoefficiens]MBR1015110.1 hypothetical protein [Bradyrhizobium diazoefficiens]MBR1052783.1 hypothetical protein [Bradyrhizobium diazoefficiens]
MQSTALRAAASVALCVTIVFVSFHVTYPSTLATTKFLGYLLVFNLLPGLIVARLLFPGASEAPVYVIVALALGTAINALTITALWSIGRSDLLFMLPVLAIGTAIVSSRRLQWAAPFVDKERGHHSLWWVVGTLFFCFTALIGVGFTFTGETPDVYSEHSAFQGMIVRALEFGWPPPNLLLPDVPLSYHYAAHLWIFGAKLTTGIPVDVLVARYGPLFLGGASAALMGAFGRYVVGLAWWTAILPVVCLYWVLGIPPISGGLFASFMPFGSNILLSPFLGVIVFLLTIAFVLEDARSAFPFLFMRAVTLAILMFLATGARGVCPAILICSLGLRLAVTIWRERELLRDNILDLVAAMAGFAVGLRFFFTLGTDYSGTGFVKFVGQPFTFLAGDQTVLTLAHTLMRWGLPSLLAGIAAFAVIAAFQAAFLTPALPAFILEFRKHPRNVDILLIGCAVAGTAGFFLTEAPGLSHVTFLYYSNIALSLLGGWGLQCIFDHGCRRRFEPTALVLVVLFFCLHLSQLPIKTIAWVGRQWSASVVKLVAFSSQPPPAVATCVRDQDAALFESASTASPRAVVIVFSPAGHCGPFWWLARSPLQTLSDYALTDNIPGRASKPALQNRILNEQRYMRRALGSAAQGVLDVPDLVAMARGLDDRPVFVMAPRALTVQGDALRMIGATDLFALWRVIGSPHEPAASQPLH